VQHEAADVVIEHLLEPRERLVDRRVALQSRGVEEELERRLGAVQVLQRARELLAMRALLLQRRGDEGEDPDPLLRRPALLVVVERQAEESGRLLAFPRRLHLLRDAEVDVELVGVFRERLEELLFEGRRGGLAREGEELVGDCVGHGSSGRPREKMVGLG
jgi:hypothetical protein